MLAEPDRSTPHGLVDGELVYAIGDVHGCYEPLRALLATIAQDAARSSAGRLPILIFCGDYIDRGPASFDVLEALCWVKRHAAFDVRFLKGNHEQVMLDYLVKPHAAREWLNLGGAETLQSYGVAPPESLASPSDHLKARDDLLGRMPAAHLRFLENLDMMLTVGDFAFVHAGVRGGVPLGDQAPRDLLWIREGFVDARDRHEKIIVHGHSWEEAKPHVTPHRIGIDTGVYETGVLTAVRLEDRSVSFLSNR